MEALVSRLNQLCDEQPFKTHWYVKDLKSGQAAHRDGDVVVYSASTRKVSIMMALFKEVHEGRMSLDDPFSIEAKYQNNRSGCFQHLKPGFEFTLHDAITMSIIVSDNTCTGKLVDMITTEKLNEYCQAIGMTDSTHRQNVPDLTLTPDEFAHKSNSTTANDQGYLLDLIVKGCNDPQTAAKLGSTPELCELALEIMCAQKIGKIDMMLPYNTKVGSKTGRGPAHHHDIGLVYQHGEPLFIIAAFTDKVAENYSNASGKYVASNHIANLTRTCWDMLAD